MYKLIAPFGCVLSIAISPALSQQQTPPTGSQPSVPKEASPSSSNAKSQSGNNTSVTAEADQIVGKQLISSDGEEAGEISGALVTNDGRVAAVLIKQSGTIGMGGKTVVVAWDRISIQGDQLTVNMTSAEVSELSEYHAD
jgi:sporulation protein YlmC with PRC-barrel domain